MIILSSFDVTNTVTDNFPFNATRYSEKSEDILIKEQEEL